MRERRWQARRRPTLRWERQAWADGKFLVAGVDEAGRGAWAGPLVAAAVILPRDPRRRALITRAVTRAKTEINDSKRLSAGQRQRVMDVLQSLDVSHAVRVVNVDDLDTVGLGNANRMALCDAVNALSPAPEHVLVDAFRLDALRCTQVPIIRGDSLSQTIALASIVAKLHRDALMAELAAEHPEYGFSVHKGYGTAAHRAAIARHGVCRHHRRSFAPIAELLAVDTGD